MVECELKWAIELDDSMLVLIDTWWNVNLADQGLHRSPDNVLIDTWWNVNYHKKFPFLFPSMVLIDTWWNVNECLQFLKCTQSGFNRYMVECEFQHHL